MIVYHNDHTTGGGSTNCHSWFIYRSTPYQLNDRLLWATLFINLVFSCLLIRMYSLAINKKNRTLYCWLPAIAREINRKSLKSFIFGSTNRNRCGYSDCAICLVENGYSNIQIANSRVNKWELHSFKSLRANYHFDIFNLFKLTTIKIWWVVQLVFFSFWENDVYSILNLLYYVATVARGGDMRWYTVWTAIHLWSSESYASFIEFFY